MSRICTNKKEPTNIFCPTTGSELIYKIRHLQRQEVVYFPKADWWNTAHFRVWEHFPTKVYITSKLDVGSKSHIERRVFDFKWNDGHVYKKK